MSKKVEIITEPKDGILPRGAQIQFDNALNSFPGKRIVITIAPKKKLRSGNQNRYYWGVIVAEFINALFDSWGVEVAKAEAHEILKKECNYIEACDTETGEVYIGKNNKSFKIPQPTSVLDTGKFEEYQDRCRKFVYEYFNVQIPLPNSQKSAF